MSEHKHGRSCASVNRYNEIRISEKYWRLLNSATQAALAVLHETTSPPADSAKSGDARGSTAPADSLKDHFVDPMTGVQRMYSTCCHLIADHDHHAAASPRPNTDIYRKSAAAATLLSQCRLSATQLTDDALVDRIPRAATAAAAALTHGDNDRTSGASEQKTLRELFCLVRYRFHCAE